MPVKAPPRDVLWAIVLVSLGWFRKTDTLLADDAGTCLLLRSLEEAACSGCFLSPVAVFVLMLVIIASTSNKYRHRCCALLLLACLRTDMFVTGVSVRPGR
jgi:hypothetical protein